MSRQATNHIIDQLEALGYLERRAPEERARRRIYVTLRAWDAAKVIHATMLHFQADWAAEIGPERFGDFMATLRIVAPRGSDAC
jgi:DNA-binding MarR family transcriptional regulator